MSHASVGVGVHPHETDVEDLWAHAGAMHAISPGRPLAMRSTARGTRDGDPMGFPWIFVFFLFVFFWGGHPWMRVAAESIAVESMC